MRISVLTTLMVCLLPFASGVAEEQRLYRWVDVDGTIHYGDSVPAEYAELEKQILNEHGVTIERLRGKKTPEEIAEEQRQAKLATALELQKRADQALLATYMSVEEILMHRDRRVELFQAQSRVTELYLKNLQRRLDGLMEVAQQFQPYNDDTDAPMIDPDLSNDIVTTKETIARHQENLLRFEQDEKNIVSRFQIDINRFIKLKGLDQLMSTQPSE